MENDIDGLGETLKRIIKTYNFSRFEILGFQNDPNLALLAGACIGYKFALDLIEKEKEK